MHLCLRFLLLIGMFAALRTRSAEFQLSLNTAQDQEHVTGIELANNSVVFAWEDESTGVSEIWFRLYSPDLLALSAPVRAHAIPVQDQAEPSIAPLTNGFVIAWSARGGDAGDYGIYFRRFDHNGVALDASPILANITTAGAQLRPDVAALTGGAFVIVWTDQSGADQDVRYRRFNGNGTALDANDLAANGWGNDARLAGDQGSARVAPLTNGGFVIVYEDRQTDDVFAVRFDGLGNPLTAPGLPSGARQLQVNQLALFDQSRPDVSSFSNGAFVVAFNSETNGAPATRRVVARFFSPEGAGSNQVVLGSFTNRTQDACVAALANGTYAAAMQAQNVGADLGSNTWSVMVQRAGSNGGVLTPSFVANIFQPDNQDRPTIVARRDGSYLAAWQSYGQDTSRYGVYAQRFTMAGEPNGGTLLIARQIPAGTNFAVTFTNGAPHVSYRLQATTNLTDWTTIRTTNTSNGVFRFDETQGGALRARSYRVVTP